MRFSAGFPTEPPFVRVVCPRFQFHTGHVTVGGSICMFELTSSGWSHSTSMEHLMLLIRTALIEGGGRLAQRRWGLARSSYELSEAQAAFTRVARQHGWH